MFLVSQCLHGNTVWYLMVPVSQDCCRAPLVVTFIQWLPLTFCSMGLIERTTNNKLLQLLVAKTFGTVTLTTSAGTPSGHTTIHFLCTKKVYEVYFEIAHLIYPTNYVLKRYRNNISESCTFCYSGTETILHLFYECIYVKFFWTEVEHVFESLCGFKI